MGIESTVQASFLSLWKMAFQPKLAPLHGTEVKRKPEGLAEVHGCRWSDGHLGVGWIGPARSDLARFDVGTGVTCCSRGAALRAEATPFSRILSRGYDGQLLRRPGYWQNRADFVLPPGRHAAGASSSAFGKGPSLLETRSVRANVLATGEGKSRPEPSVLMRGSFKTLNN